MGLTFELQGICSQTGARAGQITTEHGAIRTPVFMSVGTFGSVRFLDHVDLETCGTQIVLGNTFHLLLRPGADILNKVGGYHKLICWDKPILTDSGGFQVFSMAESRVVSEEGVSFKSYVDMATRMLTPELAILQQETIGSDIMMVLDVCVPSTSDRDTSAAAMERTHRWAKRCKKAQHRKENSLFGIVQGALFEDLREESAKTLAEMDFDGYAVGGLAVGETDAERDHFTKATTRFLPPGKPRYLMGVGTPHDLVRAVLGGIDMFDCIIPTNHARQGLAYTFQGKVKLRRTAHATDLAPIDASCQCPCCRRYTRAYLHQLIKSDEPTGFRLIALHNTWFYERLMEAMRKAILGNTFGDFASHFLKNVEE